jgi:hypothetical protein
MQTKLRSIMRLLDWLVKGGFEDFWGRLLLEVVAKFGFQLSQVSESRRWGTRPQKVGSGRMAQI